MMEEREIFINDLRINYKIAGEGPAILILHGWGSKSDRWQIVGELLSQKGLKVIIPDLPGFGNSQTPIFPWSLDDYYKLIEEFIFSLNLEKFYLLGHSFGGSVAVRYALKFPQKVEKLFLVASAGIRRKTFKKLILAKISSTLTVFSFLPLYNFLRKAFYKFIVGKSDYLLTSGVMKETYLKIIKEDISRLLSLIKTPTVIIWGQKDDVISVKDVYFFQRQIKNSKLIIIPHGDHDMEQKIPEDLAKEILKNLSL